MSQENNPVNPEQEVKAALERFREGQEEIAKNIRAFSEALLGEPIADELIEEGNNLISLGTKVKFESERQKGVSQ